ncbi:hypothetical protein BC936DRAFT_147099, partial [Jimgerdemannia flammicorona]
REDSDPSKEFEQRLRFPDYWKRPRDEWSLETFKTYVNQHGIVDKAEAHNCLGKEIKELKILFARSPSSQLRLNELVGQLKARRGQKELRTATTKSKIIEKKIETTKNTAILNGYRRVDEHYESFHAKLLNFQPSVDNGRVEDDERQEDGDMENDNPFLVQSETEPEAHFSKQKNQREAKRKRNNNDRAHDAFAPQCRTIATTAAEEAEEAEEGTPTKRTRGHKDQSNGDDEGTDVESSSGSVQPKEAASNMTIPNETKKDGAYSDVISAIKAVQEDNKAATTKWVLICYFLLSTIAKSI